MTEVRAFRPCRICNRPNVWGPKKSTWILGQVILRDGRHSFCWKCEFCQHLFPDGSALWIARSKILTRVADPEKELPVFKDYLTEDGRVCEVCGKKGAQEHHWAPRHLFGNKAWDWPTGFLCAECHRRWHDVVTPNMSRKEKGNGNLGD
jgi:hypothetical protein